MHVLLSHLADRLRRSITPISRQSFGDLFRDAFPKVDRRRQQGMVVRYPQARLGPEQFARRGKLGRNALDALPACPRINGSSSTL
jgi:hypothetical protein